MAKNEKTGKRAGTIASGLLRDPKAPINVKTVAASDLAQRPDKPAKRASKAKKKV